MIVSARIIFLLLLASIPVQLGKHFWPNFSFVQGIRVDYLSPTLYVSDCIFILLFVLTIYRFYKQLLHVLVRPLFLCLIAALLISSVFSLYPVAALYGSIKLFEFFYIAFFISKTFKRSDISLFTYIFTLGALVESVIVILQFISQHSLGGPFYFLGERMLNASTLGAAVFQLNGQLVLRPYGTFPHPNVLAFYLLFAFVVLLYLFNVGGKFIKFIKVSTLLLISLGIFLTFSRVIILLLMGVYLIWFYNYSKSIFITKKEYIFFLSCLFMATIFALFSQRFKESFIRDTLSRLELINISFSIFMKNPLFGVGLNNFYYHEILLQKNITPTLLQPVHNVYLLWVVNTGLIGGFSMFLFIRNTYKRLKNSLQNKQSMRFYKMTFVLFVCALAVSFFDHYLITLQQGQLMLSIILGLSFSRIKVKKLES